MNTNKDLLKADELARIKALDISKSFIVQAPAGSGKTELLIQRYLKSLSFVSHPEETIAITFTNKAAYEIKQRVLSALENANNKIEASKEHEINTAKLAHAVLQADKKNKWDLIRANHRIKISTLDSFCAEIVNRSPISSKFGLNRKIGTDRELQSIYHESAVSALNFLLSSKTSNKDAENILFHLDGNLSRYIIYLTKMLEMRDQWSYLIGSGVKISENHAARLRRKLEKNIQQIISEHQKKLCCAFPKEQFSKMRSLFSYLNESNPNYTRLNTQHSVDLLFHYKHNQDWILIANLLLTKEGMWRKRIDKNIGFPAAEKNHKKVLQKIIDDLAADDSVRNLLHMVRRLPPPHYEEKQWSVLLSLFNLLPTATAELKRIFVQKNTSDYTELSDCAHQALGDNDNPTDLALMMDYRLKHIMVDEIQDTSSRQYELIEKLIQGWEENDGRSLFLVGDPMQSIYRFRNASVSQFLLTAKNGIGELKPENLILRKNFRSDALLVNEFNNVFETILPKSEDLIIGGVKFNESIPIAEKMNLGNYQLHTLFNESVKSEAIYTVNLIKKKIVGTKGNIAVLVRSRLHLMPILHLLKREAVAYQAIEIDRLTDLPEIIDMLSLSRALCHKNDKAAWLALLRSPLVGLTWNEILVLLKGDKDKSIWELLHEKQRIKSLSENSQLLLSNFREIIAQFIEVGNMAFLRDRVEKVWYRLKGPALLKSPEQLENIKRYLDVLGEIEVGGSLEDPLELEELIDNIRVSSSPNKEARIQVMTIHKAKGLEFDHVILPSLGRITRPSEKTVLNWLENPINENAILISPIGSAENDKLHSYIQNSIKESEALELDRLLYVAFTRASRSLDVIGNVKVKNEDNNLFLMSPSKSSLLYRLWNFVEANFQREAKYQFNKNDKIIEVRKKYLIPTLKRINKNYQIPIDKNPIVLDSLSLDLNTEKSDLIEFSWAGESAKQAGIIVHRWIHKFSLEKQIPAISDLPSYMDISKNWARNNYVKEGQLTDVINRAEETLINIIEDKDNHWFIIGNGFSELPLTGIWNKRCYSVIIDRINIDAKENHWLIDYKTGTHRGGNVNKFINDEVVRYQGQLEKYATIYKNYSGIMPTVALYFPNLKKLQLIDFQ